MDLTCGRIVANISGSCNHTFGSAMVDVIGGKETMVVFATRWARFQAPHEWCPSPAKNHWRGQCGSSPAECTVDAFASSDLAEWSTSPALKPGFAAYNTDVTKVNATLPGVGHVGYVMVVEHPGGPVGWQSQVFVTSASSPLTGWRILNGSVATVACPCVRYIPATGYIYVLGAGSFSHSFQGVVVKRSRDMRTWQSGGLLLVPNRTSADVTPFDGSSLGMFRWSPASESRFFNVSTLLQDGNVWDLSAADPDAREMTIDGVPKVLMFWTAGNQKNWGFVALGVFDGSLADYLEGPFGGASGEHSCRRERHALRRNGHFHPTTCCGNQHAPRARASTVSCQT